MRSCLRALILCLPLLAPAVAKAEVRVVPLFDPADHVDRAAVGLLVPGAGPEVTREGALAALLRGELEHDLLGGVPTGPPLLELGKPGGPVVLVSLPPPGTSTNDRRYPIAVLGSTGVLTSDSTRIDGLVSVTDIATGRLRAVPSTDPREVLERLDERIERNDRRRLPLTILLVAVVLALALVRPGLAMRAVLVALAANLWLDPWLALLAGAAAVAFPLGLACGGVLAVYLVSLGLDAETVALSPLGPSQSGRFYGINNLLETLLLGPALVGAALLGRAGILVAVLALVTVGGNRFGADGGGLVVLAVAYLVLALRLRGARPTPRLLAAAAAGAAALALLLLAFDAATGGESHVTRAVGDGPVALAGDLADRLELSVRRTAAGPGATAVVLAGLVLLTLLATRRPRRPLLDALLAGLAVSLLVNDTPGDVVAVGSALAVTLVRAPWLDSAPMLRPAAIALTALALAVPGALAACGGSEETSPTPETVEGTLPEATTEDTDTGEEPTSTVEGDAAAGEAVWASAGCGGCHTMEAAGSTGNVGPNLDDAQPAAGLVTDRVTNGRGAMPAFADQLDEKQIADVVAYVVASTSG